MLDPSLKTPGAAVRSLARAEEGQPDCPGRHGVLGRLLGALFAGTLERRGDSKKPAQLQNPTFDSSGHFGPQAHSRILQKDPAEPGDRSADTAEAPEELQPSQQQKVKDWPNAKREEDAQEKRGKMIVPEHAQDPRSR